METGEIVCRPRLCRQKSGTVQGCIGNHVLCKQLLMLYGHINICMLLKGSVATYAHSINFEVLVTGKVARPQYAQQQNSIIIARVSIIIIFCSIRCLQSARPGMYLAVRAITYIRMQAHI